MKFLYLVDKKIYDTKMDRVRFHTIDALARYPGVWLKKTGPNWDGFNMETCLKEYKPNFVIWFKPLEMENYQLIANSRVIKIIRFHEMWDVGRTTKEIVMSNSDIIVCAHINEIKKYKHLSDKKYKFYHNPICVEKRIFKDYGEEKIYDVLLIGSLKKDIYPLRNKFKEEIFPRLKKKGYICKVLEHPGYRIDDVDEQIRNYAKEINRSKIVVTCSSIFRYAVHKYVEVPLCGSLLCADLPNERKDWFRKWMLVVKLNESAGSIVEKIEYYLQNDDERNKLIKRGMRLNQQQYTQEKYVERLLKIIIDYLKWKKFSIYKHELINSN
jgi:hypothetical protein